MGNRAVLTLENMPDIGIYVHWNGGPGSVLAFVKATKRRGARSPGNDPTYALGRLAQTTADFFCSSKKARDLAGITELTSFGIGPIEYLDTSDNGIYKIGPNWEVRDRNNQPIDYGQLEGYEAECYRSIVALLLLVDEARQQVFDDYSS